MKLKRNSLSTLSSLIIMIFLFCSCANTVTISRDYIYSTGWSKGEYQGFQIAKIKLKDSAMSVFDNNFSRFLLSNYIIDSSFCYGAGNSHGKSTNIGKVFFDKKNNSVVWYECNDILKYNDSIGLLELDTWYIILGLRGTEDFYVYIDNDGNSYTYSLGPTNW